MRVDHTEPLACPHCEAVNDAHASDPGDSPPEPGHLSMCIYCEQVGVFDTDPLGRLIIRKPTEDEAAELAGSPVLDQWFARLAELKRRHGPPPIGPRP